eukprot:751198-Hanusia_phi.AAC.2
MPSETPMVLKRYPTMPDACEARLDAIEYNPTVQAHLDSLLNLPRKIKEMHVARVSLIPNAGDADLEQVKQLIRALRDERGST